MSKTPLAPLSIVNGRLILPGEGEPVEGGIRVLGDRIAEIGRITPSADDRVHDAKGALIAPGPGRMTIKTAAAATAMTSKAVAIRKDRVAAMSVLLTF